MLDLASAESRLAAIEAKLVANEKTVAAWFRANWAHFVTWAGVLAPFILKHI
jgi:hypothetical protein